MTAIVPGGGGIALLGDLLALGLIAFVTLLAAEVPVADTRPAAGAELVDLRTEHSRTVDNGDGTRTTTTSIEPLHFRAADGALERVATQLVAHGRDSVINRAAGFRVAFDRRAGEDFVRLEHDDRRLGLTLEGARPAEAEVRGSSVAYRDVADDVSLEYESRPSSVKETIVIEGRNAPARYRFRLSQPAGSDLRARRMPGGAWLLSDRAAPGSRFVVEAPWAVDARGAGVEDSGARLDVSRDGDDLLLDVAVDARWLRSSRRAFPVRLDPTISVAASGWLTYNARCTTCNGTVYYTGNIGTAPGDQFWRTAVRFNLAGIPAEARITDADVEMFWEGACLVASTGPCGSHTFNAHRITAGWDSSSRPGEIATDNAVVSSYSLPSGAAPRWLAWDVTALARDWHDGTAPNFGVTLKTPNEATTVDGIKALVYQSRMAVTYAVDQVTLYGAEDVGPAGATLIWSRFAGQGFAGYEVHRSPTAGFTPSSATRLTTLTSLDETRFEDTTAAPGTSFSYKIVTGGKASNEQRVALPAANQPSRTLLRLDPAGGQATGITQVGPGLCTNEGGDPTITIAQGRRGLLRFDLRDIAPASRIASARLSLWRTDRSDTTGGQLELAPVAREWGEGSTADCTSDGATWAEAQSGVPWTTAGGDVTAGGVNSTLPVDTPPGWQEWDVTALAREWVAGQRANHGLRLARPAGPAIRFTSDDDTISPSLRPKLEIVYADPDPVGVPTAGVIAPRHGERVRGTITIEAAAGDDRRVERVEFLVDGVKVAEDATAPYATAFDTRAKTNGTHTLRVRAVDDAGNTTTSDPVDVEVANFDPPTVRLTSPAADYTGTVRGDAPAGHWRLGETSGTTAIDASGNNRHGVLGGYYGLGQPGLLTGDADRSIRLNAGYGRVTAAGFDYGLSPRVSVEAWISHPGFTATADTEIVSNNFAAVGGWALGVRRLSTGAQQAYFAVRTSTGVVYAPQAIAPSATNPPTYHLVGTFDGSFAGLYLDAQRDGTWSATAAATGNGTVVIGNRTAADLRVDDVAVYPSVLTREQVKTHFELGRGRQFWVEGQNDLRADATPGAGRTLRGVEFLVDGHVAAEDLAAPYTVPWDTLAAAAPVPDGAHTVVARATDDHGRVTDSAPVTASVQNTAGAPHRAELTAAGPLPGSLIHDPAAANQATTPVDVRVKNTGSSSLGSNAVLRARWIRPDGTFDDSTGADVALGAALAPGAERIVTAQVAPPALPPGADRARMTLRLDLRDTAAPQTWWAARGNPPLDHSAMIQRVTPVGLGLERYYHYDGESLGAGMSHLVNLASGNSIVRFTPFASPGRGLSTVVDLTYNSKAGGTAEPGPGGPKPQELRASPLGPAWSIAISSLSPLGEPLRCAAPPNSALHPHKCEDIATKTTPDLPAIVMELTDADGTVHRFNGRRTAGHTTWQEPQGVHLYLRELEADERPACDIADGNPSKLMWAFTRPDGVTFYYENNGWPTGAGDRDGNCVDLKVEDPGNDKRLRVTEVVDAAGVANPALRARRTYRLAYGPGQPGPGGGSPNYPQLASITDHTGSKLSFDYFNDDYLRRITQQGGTTPEGTSAPSRTWSFRWTDQKFDGQYTVPNASEDKTNPKNSFRLYSVTDPKGKASTFTYVADGHANKKDAGKLAWRIDREQAQTSFAYDETARTTTVDLPEGRHSRYTFDAEGSVSRIVDRVAVGREETTQVAWTADRHVRTVTEPTGAFTEFDYNANGYLTKRWDQLRRLTQLEYEPVAIDDDDVAANWRAGRAIPHISQLTKRITPRNKEWLFDREDATGRLLGVTDPEGFVTRHAYNTDGTLRETREGLRADGAGGYATPAGEPVRTTTYPSYDANGLPAEQVDPAGGRTRFCHDDDGLLRWIQDPRHAGSPVPPDPSRCFEHDGRAYRSHFDYDPLHRLTRQSAPKSTQHEPGNLIWSHARFDPNDNVTDQFGPVYGPTFRDGAGTRTQFTHDAMDRGLSETLFDFDTELVGEDLRDTERTERTERVYDKAGRVTRITSPRGVATTSPTDDFTTSVDYDGLDRVLRQRRIGYDAGQRIERITHHCYDAAGDLRSVTGPRLGLPQVACEAEGAPAGTPFTHRLEYTAAHEPRRAVDPGADVTTQTYDADGNPWVSTDAADATTTRSYDGRGLLVETVEDFEGGADPRRLTTKLVYDAVGNLRHQYSPRAVEAAGGNPSPSSDFVHSIEYDALNRPVRELLPRRASEDRRYVHRRFDSLGNLTNVTVPVEEADLATILASTAATKDWVTRYEHFDPGWVRSSEDASPRVDFEYDAEGRQTGRRPTRSPSDTRDTDRTFYRDGKLRTFSDEKGNLLLRRYDRNGNLTLLNDSGVTSSRRTLTLDVDHTGFDQIASTSAREPGRTTRVTAFTYDLGGNIATRADDRELDASSQAEVRAPRRHEFTYDPEDLLTEHLDRGRQSAATDDKRITTSYDAADRRARRTVEQWIGAAGTGGFQARQTTRWDFYENGLVKRLRTFGGSDADDLTLREEHNLSFRDTGGTYVNGHRTRDSFFRKSPKAGTSCQSPSLPCERRWTYDGGDRLIEEDNGNDIRTKFVLEPAGGIKERIDLEVGEPIATADFDGTRIERFTTGGETRRMHYDVEGNLDCETTDTGTAADCNEGSDPPAALEKEYTYDYRNRLLAWRSDDKRVTYERDAIDRLTKETEVAGEQESTHELAYVGTSKSVAEEQETGERDATRSYSYDAHGERIGLTFKRGTGDTKELSYAQDPHGDVSMLIDEAGATKASYGHLAYGESDPGLTAETLPDSGDDPDPGEKVSRFGYTNKRADALSETVDMGARTFSPQLGAFIQEDRFEDALADLDLSTDALTSNRYALAGGNPISFVETDGHDPHAIDTHANGGCFTCGGSRRGARASLSQSRAAARGAPDDNFPNDSNYEQLTPGPPASGSGGPSRNAVGWYEGAVPRDAGPRALNTRSTARYPGEPPEKARPSGGPLDALGGLSCGLSFGAVCFGDENTSDYRFWNGASNYIDLRKGAVKTADEAAEAVGQSRKAPAPTPAAVPVARVNRAGQPYPNVPDPRTGQPIAPPPAGLGKVPKADRAPWGPTERGEFIKEWHERGHSTPAGGWTEYDIHHVQPREYGGTNDFDNLVPVKRETHQQEFNPWWAGY